MKQVDVVLTKVDSPRARGFRDKATKNMARLRTGKGPFCDRGSAAKDPARVDQERAFLTLAENETAFVVGREEQRVDHFVARIGAE